MPKYTLMSIIIAAVIVTAGAFAWVRRLIPPANFVPAVSSLPAASSSATLEGTNSSALLPSSVI